MTTTRPRCDGALAAFAGLACFLALLQVFCLWSGALGLTLDRGLAVTGVLAALVLSCAFALRFREPIPDTTVPEAAGRGRLSTWLARAAGAAALVWAGIVWIRLWILVWRRPPFDWDGLYYHLPAVHGWARAGHVTWLDTIPDVPYVNFPMGVETTTFLTHRLLQTSRLVNGGNLWYWPLAFLALVVLATRLGARGIWRWLAGALLVGAPVLVSQSASCYVDAGFAATVMAAVAASCLFVFHDGRAPGWKALLFGASVGLVAGAKGTGAPFSALFFLVVAAGVLAVHGFRRWRTWLLQLVVAGSVVLAAGGFWYLRNTLHTGNPIHPIQLELGDRVLFEGYDPTSQAEDCMPDWLAAYPPALRLPVAWLQLDAPIHGFDPIGGMGYLWIGAAVPAILLLGLWTLRRRSRPHAPAYAFTLALVLVLLAVQPASWWARFTIWLHALGLPCLAVLLHHWTTSVRPVLRGLAVALLAGTVGLAIWESGRTLSLEEQTGRLPPAEGGGAAYRTTQEMIFHGMAETPGFDRFLAADRIGRSRLGRYGFLAAGMLALPLGRREITVLSPRPDEGEIRRLQERGVRWVFWDMVGGGEVPEPLARIALEEHAYHPNPETDFRILHLPPP